MAMFHFLYDNTKSALSGHPLIKEAEAPVQELNVAAPRSRILTLPAGVAELADAADLKSAGAILEGSSPSPGTIKRRPVAFMLVAAYFIGSFPTAYLLVLALRRQDIRSLGDGNMGAQNTFRQVSPAAGLTVALVDCLKGALVILIAREWGMGQTVIMLSGLAAVDGHNWPWFLGFRGGRGEATTVGVLLALAPLPMTLALMLGTLTLLITRSVSRASVPLFISMPLVCWYFGVEGWIIAYSMALPCLAGLTSYWRTKRPRLARVT